ncbi:MAG: hypothetical protein ACR2HN_13245, partial [Tepidiformaceae bacterium]
EGFRLAQTAAGTTERHFRIAGYAVRICFAGAAMVPFITGPLAHLAAAPSPAPDLTVRCWDSRSSGVLLPAGVGGVEQYIAAQRTGRLGGSSIRAAIRRPDYGLSMLDPSASEAIYWLAAASVPPIGSGSPLLVILAWWMGAHGRQLVHAAAVGLPGKGGLLLTGGSGSGKSTSSLLALQAGMDFAGDDYCLVNTEGPPYVHSLYSSAKLVAAKVDAGRSPVTLDVPGRLEFEKYIYLLAGSYSGQLVAGMRLRAVVAPAPSALPEPRLSALAAGDALRSLAPSTLLQVKGLEPGALALMGRLVSTLPCYRLELGGTPAAIPAALRALLEEGP